MKYIDRHLSTKMKRSEHGKQLGKDFISLSFRMQQQKGTHAEITTHIQQCDVKIEFLTSKKNRILLQKHEIHSDKS